MLGGGSAAVNRTWLLALMDVPVWWEPDRY